MSSESITDSTIILNVSFNGVRLPVDRVFLDVVCGASMATINVFNEAIDKSMGLSCKEANEGVVPDFC